MIAYIIVRLSLGLVTLLAIISFNFILLNLLNVNPLASTMANIGYSANHLQPISHAFNGQFNNLLLDYFGLQGSLGERLLHTLLNYLSFDLGKSFTYNQSVLKVIVARLPVSLSLGLFSTILLYLLGISIGYIKAKQPQAKLNILSNFMLILLSIIPIFILAIVAKIFFEWLTGVSLEGLVAENFQQLSWYGKIFNYLYHIIVPVMVSVTSMLAFNIFFHQGIFLQEMSKLYYHYALSYQTSAQVFRRHLLKNVLLVSLADFPAVFLGVLFGNSLFIEIIFKLNGIGLMTYDAFYNQDYPLILGIIYLMSLIGLSIRIFSDIIYTILDPRVKLKIKL